MEEKKHEWITRLTSNNNMTHIAMLNRAGKYSRRLAAACTQERVRAVFDIPGHDNVDAETACN
jgi:hypothetical protein